MMRPKDGPDAAQIDQALRNFSLNHTPLLGISDVQKRRVFIAQLIESKRRIDFVRTISARAIAPGRADPKSDMFDPLRGAILNMRKGDRDEAFWMIFLATHFSKHHIDGWELMRAVYGKLGATPYWTWRATSRSPTAFRSWLRGNQNGISKLRFGNHRKYESRREDSSRGLANVIESYVSWVGASYSHDQKFGQLLNGINNPETAFDMAYKEIDKIFTWGRLAKFDHLTMLSKIGLLNAVPGHIYLRGATGPSLGAALMLYNNTTHKLDIQIAQQTFYELGQALNVGQQELEDSLCNWQKSPSVFIAFR